MSHSKDIQHNDTALFVQMLGHLADAWAQVPACSTGSRLALGLLIKSYKQPEMLIAANLARDLTDIEPLRKKLVIAAGIEDFVRDWKGRIVVGDFNVIDVTTWSDELFLAMVQPPLKSDDTTSQV